MLYLVFASSRYCSCLERELTVEIPAQKEECFYEYVKTDQLIDVEYQVIDGGQTGDFGIDFRVIRPDGVPLLADLQKSDAAHHQSVRADGDYKFCFDNTNSRFGSKIVYFELTIENDSDDDEADRHDIDMSNYNFAEEDNYEMQVRDIDASLRMIRDRISRSRHIQDQLRAFEFRDRSVAEHNFERVNFWSTVQLFLMVAAAVVQVVLVRSIFDEQSAVHKLWKN